jgi:hypothetical protein
LRYFLARKAAPAEATSMKKKARKAVLKKK